MHDLNTLRKLNDIKEINEKEDRSSRERREKEISEKYYAKFDMSSNSDDMHDVVN